MIFLRVTDIHIFKLPPHMTEPLNNCTLILNIDIIKLISQQNFLIVYVNMTWSRNCHKTKHIYLMSYHHKLQTHYYYGWFISYWWSVITCSPVHLLLLVYHIYIYLVFCILWNFSIVMIIQPDIQVCEVCLFCFFVASLLYFQQTCFQVYLRTFSRRENILIYLINVW